jgi:hypothetical protein
MYPPPVVNGRMGASLINDNPPKQEAEPMKKSLAVLTLTMACLLFSRSARAEPKTELSPQVEGSRAVLAAVVRVARENAQRPARDRLDGDELTVLYIRAAAEAARQLPKETAAGAFLVGVGLGLDDSKILRSNPLVARFCHQVESDAERDVRLKVVGQPTMRKRRDWTQHFVVSCALVEMVGPQLAEAAGVFKEQMDSRPGGSGFSFGDLNADLAGVAFASRLKKDDLSFKTLAARFAVNDYLPDAADLREGLTEKMFARDYGGLDDPRFKTEVAGIRKRIDALVGYKEK